MIMLSRPEFAVLNAYRGAPSQDPDPVAGWRGLTWPANEIMLRSLLATGRTIADIAGLYDVAPERVMRRVADYGM